MLSNKFNFILTLIISIALFIFMKSRQPKGKGSLETEKNKTEVLKEIPKDHPLKHIELEIIDVPSGTWADGFLDIHKAMDYIFASEEERKLAVNALLKSGYGHGKTDFLYFKDSKITVNGSVYNSVKEAKDYLSSSAIQKLRVFVFKKEDFPTEIKVDNVKFYMVPWDKRDLPNIDL